MANTKVPKSQWKDAAAGDCIFTTTSATNCRLSRFNGKGLFINGAWYEVPSAGVDVSNGGLGATTLYYCYAYMSSGTMTLEFSTTARATDSTYGHQIKSGDATRTLVGLVRTNSSSQFFNTVSARLVRSWFNDEGINGYKLHTADVGIGSGPWVEVNSGYRAEMVLWLGESVHAVGSISWYDGTGAGLGYTSAGMDGAGTIIAPYGITTITTAGYQGTTAHGIFSGLTEGYHYLTLLAGITGGSAPTVINAYSGVSYITTPTKS